MEYNWTDKDWVEFEKAHPGAASLLLHRSLLNEQRNLQIMEAHLNEWGKKRLAELNEWAKALGETIEMKGE